jgi:hypothetical protein
LRSTTSAETDEEKSAKASAIKTDFLTMMDASSCRPQGRQR